jgi:hypothetical protein
MMAEERHNLHLAPCHTPPRSKRLKTHDTLTSQKIERGAIGR